MAVHKELKTADVAIPGDSNIRKKEHQKIEKCQSLKEQLEHKWTVKFNVVPMVMRALGGVTKLESDLDRFLEQQLRTEKMFTYICTICHPVYSYWPCVVFDTLLLFCVCSTMVLEKHCFVSPCTPSLYIPEMTMKLS